MKSKERLVRSFFYMARSYFKIICFILVLGCASESDISPVVDGGEQYFPLELGSYSIFDVGRADYDLNGKDSSNYQMKVLVADTFSIQDQLHYVLNTYIRDSSEDNWVIDEIRSAYIWEEQVLVQQNGELFLALSLPLKEGKAWDGNTYNAGDYDRYEYRYVAEPFEGYQTTVTVIQNEIFDTIDKTDYRVEVYSKDTGLVFKEIQIINYCSIGDCVGQQIIENGLIYKQTLIENGKE